MTDSASNTMTIMGCDDAWDAFMNDEYTEDVEQEINHLDNQNIPKCSEIYISTKTKISYLNKPIDLKKCFWKIPVTPYHKPVDGVIKKQIKYNFKTKEEVKDIEGILENEYVVDQQSISKIDNPDGKIKFKDIRKISIGVCKKDILSYRSKKKSAFYNCFVLILRLKYEGEFKESHVKVFNTGKLELPGIQSDDFLKLVLDTLVKILNDSCGIDISYLPNTSETVLINSNFSSNYFINREKLVSILKTKYNLNTTYDPCSYPGIMSKFYYNNTKAIQNGKEPSSEEKKKLLKDGNLKEVSFMIFRTGSVLIVGKCEEKALMDIYTFLKQILHTEYHEIRQYQQHQEKKKKKVVKKKVRRRLIVIH